MVQFLDRVEAIHLVYVGLDGAVFKVMVEDVGEGIVVLLSPLIQEVLVDLGVELLGVDQLVLDLRAEVEVEVHQVFLGVQEEVVSEVMDLQHHQDQLEDQVELV